MVTDALSEIEDINPVKFVGQSSKYKDKGLTQKQQVEIIDHFKQGNFNVLVATSVAEEGLDIPATDLVVFMNQSLRKYAVSRERGEPAANMPAGL